MSKTFTPEEVATHKTKDNLWVVVEGDVYDLTKYVLPVVTLKSPLRGENNKYITYPLQLEQLSLTFGFTALQIPNRAPRGAKDPAAGRW